MSKRRILNVSSEKKKDDMLIATNVVSPRNPANTSYTAQPAILTGGSADEYLFAWIATHRTYDPNFQPAARGSKFQQATRTAQTCYMVGLKETIEIQTSTNCPWQWRRICFTQKSARYTTVAGQNFYLLTSNGVQRVVNEVNSAKNDLYSALFQGYGNTDWNDPMTAKTDPLRVTIKYDKTITFQSPNDSGTIRAYKRWHPMGKNLVYDDDERGGDEEATGFSVQSKAGMGDYFVVDIFRPRVGSTTADQLLFRPQATLYWHEK